MGVAEIDDVTVGVAEADGDTVTETLGVILGVLVGVEEIVGVSVGVTDGVTDGLAVLVGVAEILAVLVGVIEGVDVLVGVIDIVGVAVGVNVGVTLGVAVSVGVKDVVGVNDIVGVTVGVDVGAIRSIDPGNEYLMISLIVQQFAPPILKEADLDLESSSSGKRIEIITSELYSPVKTIGDNFVAVGVGVTPGVGVIDGAGVSFSMSYAAFTLSMPPVTTFPVRLGLGVAEFSIASLISYIVLLGKAPCNKAKAPATCGAAILVPLAMPYPIGSPGNCSSLNIVLNILVPGAEISTVVGPKLLPV